MYPSQAKGFTLVELMIVIAVAATLAAMAFPSFQSSIRANRVSTASNELMASFALARSEAIRSARGGGVCASADGKSCVAGSWGDGWLVWTDTNADRALNEGEPVIRYVQAKQKLTMVGTVGILAFDNRGRSTSGTQSIGLKPSDEATPARCILLSPTGQTQIKKGACS